MPDAGPGGPAIAQALPFRVMARRQLHDEYFKKAKAHGYLARSAYKLIEINERKKIIRRGGRDAVFTTPYSP